MLFQTLFYIEKNKKVMRLEKVLDQLSSLEKNSFIKLIDNLINESPKNKKEIEKILAQNEGDLKSADSLNISKIFSLLEIEYSKQLEREVRKSSVETDLIIEIFMRDGNCIMSRDWLNKLIDNELREFGKKVKSFSNVLKLEPKGIDPERLRDYNIYKECVDTAFNNDLEYGLEPKITNDEKSILFTLSNQLELSNEEVRLIEAIILKYKKPDIDSVIKELKEVGIILFAKKDNQIFVPDEIVRLIRRIRGKDVPDKFFRRVLRHLKEGQINILAKKHNIDKKLTKVDKIQKIIDEGVGFRHAILQGIYKPGTSKTEIKNNINKLADTDLKIEKGISGNTIEAKTENLIKYFDELDKDPKVIISIDGYDKLLRDLSRIIPKVKQKIKSEFQLQDDNVFTSKFLLDYNIKPRDILYLLNDLELTKFCQKVNVTKRGDLIHNILKNYKDAENLYIENYHLLANRDWKGLKDNGILVKEAELGIRFEDVTKSILKKLGFNVDESLRKKLNTAKDKIDIVLNLGSNNLILVECKSHKSGDFGKYSSVSRQIKAYNNLATKNKEYMVLNTLIIAPGFTDDFVKECGLEIELSLSLITASSLKQILDGFKESSLEKFPHTLFTRDVVIKEDRILKAILK